MIRDFLSKYFGFIFLLACLLGLIIPDPGNITQSIIPLMLSIVIFSSYFQADFRKEAIFSSLKSFAVFYTFRFILIPLSLFVVLNPFSDFYSTVILIFFLLPAAVSAPAFTQIFKGNVNLSITTVILTNSFTPLLIPAACFLFLQNGTEIDLKQMFITIVLTIIVPFIIHLPLRKYSRFKNLMINANQFITVLLISVMYTIATAKYKPVIMNNLPLMLGYLALIILVLLSMYIIGWYIMPSKTKAEKISGSICSGANNTGLGVALTILYFSAEISIFFIVAQIAWAIVLIPLRKIMMHSKIQNEKYTKMF